MALASGLADADVLVFEIAHLTDCRSAVQRNISHFTEGMRSVAMPFSFAINLCKGSGCTGNLSAFFGLKLDVVYRGAYGDIRKRNALPALISAPVPLMRVSPTERPTGARI